jgi:protein-tyrosine phosphatase
MAPFTVLHVCMGNICRSPMAERLLVHAARSLVGSAASDLLYVHGAGTGGWHQGKPMHPGAARQLGLRGADSEGFAARQLLAEYIDSSDLVLTATGEHLAFVLELRPDAAGRTFVLGQFARLLSKISLDELPPSALSPDGVYERGVALVAAVDAARAGDAPLPGDDLDDPYGYDDAVFDRVAEQIDEAVRPLASALLT